MHLGLPLCRGRLTVTHLMDKAYVISILSFYAEGDKGRLERVVRYVKFQSSPSMQRETSIVYVTLYHMMYFNPLPLCRGRHNHLVFLQQRFLISILSLYTEGDIQVYIIFCNPVYFNPLPLYRGRHESYGCFD